MFIPLGQITKQTEQFNEICQILVPRALNDTKKIRKVDGDMFANVRPEQPHPWPLRNLPTLCREQEMAMIRLQNWLVYGESKDYSPIIPWV